MAIEGTQGLVHVGPRVELGGGKYGNLPPEQTLWVISASYSSAKGATTLYVMDVDSKKNPIYTSEINNSAKFDRWSDIKKFWRGTTQRPPKEIPLASIKLEEQAFGKGPIRSVVS